ncbi:MFS transporter [Acuticoccus sp. I52.16.1]|uniref:MFS transporter n=1 Tax=Acuticoccus sp. I52.16.1 TaxID=2928472 RepID=UPI001FD6154A|nr:MFS transporter [Acuticoccus sp. I52.16.1]UOM35284.1 MFS transporter [Acuticoccus sp. I52.16.1]
MLRPNVTALIIASALFMENLDSTVISTALPTIAADIGSDPVRLKLALTAYLLSLATFIPISGWAADRFGARTVFRCAIGVFVLGSVMCSASSSLPEFVVSRVVQGAGGAMMTPVGRLVLLRSTEKSKLLDAMAWFTTPALIGPLMGPPVGGFIATYFDWRWIFWINVPVGAIGILLVTLFIAEVRAEERPPLDIVGFVLSGVSLSGLVFGLSVLGQAMLPLPVALAMIGVGLLSGAAYLWHAKRVAHPLLDLDLLRTQTFFTAAIGGSLFRIGIGAIPFLLPLSLQLGLGMSAFSSGSLVFLGAAGALLMKMTAKPIVHRFGFRSTLIVNGVIAAVCLGAMATFVADPGPIAIASILLVGGFFRSLQFTCLNALAYADVSSRRMSRATSLSSVAQQVSLALGVSVGAFVVEIQRSGRADDTIVAGDFVAAFLTVAAIALCAVVFYLRLPRDAGAEISGAVRAARTPVAST